MRNILGVAVALLMPVAVSAHHSFAAEFDAAHQGEIPRPAHWGGYRLLPDVYEFWEHRENRLHERLRYRRTGETWTAEPLQP